MTRLNRLLIPVVPYVGDHWPFLAQPISISRTAWHSAKWATSTNPYSFDLTKKLMSPAERSSLSSVKPENVTILQLAARAAFTAFRIFGDRPELLIATRRSPARP